MMGTASSGPFTNVYPVKHRKKENLETYQATKRRFGLADILGGGGGGNAGG